VARIKRSREIEFLLTAHEWRGSVGYDVTPYGRFGLVPNPYPPNPQPPDDTVSRLVFQDFDCRWTVDITGWSAAHVYQLVNDRQGGRQTLPAFGAATSAVPTARRRRPRRG
jgi:hypothetical protein